MSEDDDDDDLVVEQRKQKNIVFTVDERKLLLKLVNLHYDVLNNKKVDNTTTQQKQDAWNAIHKKYLENTALIKQPRTVQQLKRCWENMKCKARRGDQLATRLIRWGEAQYRRLESEKKKIQEKINGNSISLDSGEENSDNEIKLDNSNSETKMEESQNPAIQILNENFCKIKEALENSDCTHCACDKIEKSAQVQLITLQKQLYEELHQLKMQLTRERLKHDKELHKLQVHEMTLKIENERRRAEILERELGD